MTQSRTMILWPLRTLLCVAAGALTCAGAQALPASYTFSLQAYSSAPGGGSQNFFGITSASPLSKTGSYSDGPLGASEGYVRRGPSSMTTVVIADSGLLSVAFQGSSSSVSDPVAGVVAGAQTTGRANIVAKWTDFIVSGPGSGTVAVSFNALIDNSYLFSRQSDLFSSIPGTTLFVVAVGGASIALNQHYYTQSAAITSAAFNIQVGVPFDLRVNMSTDITWAASQYSLITTSPEAGLVDTINFHTSFALGAVSAQVQSNSADLLTADALASSGPVFNLPAGYTLNSVQANIVDNRWLGGTLAAVPEPATMALMLFGLAGVVCRSRAVALTV